MVLKEMKRRLIVWGVIAIALIMVSTATAVPQAHSRSVMNVVNDMEQKKALIEQNLAAFSEKLADKLVDAEPGGLIDLLIAILMAIINFVNAIIQFIFDLFDLVGLVEYFIERITYLIGLIMSFIELIIEIFTPGNMATSLNIN